ncbi:hypothetical protein SDC9_152596 [bioreactor metagenome]|uniref:Uncharacterized protein n=1 Tax=bioreactor metagenome TaxID=1076179 RepID=A0A645EV90_9ZZZZ
MILRLHGGYGPTVFHARQLRHTLLFVEHFVVIDDHVLGKPENRIASVFQLEHAAPGQVLYRGNKECDNAEQQTNAVELVPATLLFIFFTTYGDNAEGENKYPNQITVPGEDGQDFGGLFHIG